MFRLFDIVNLFSKHSGTLSATSTDVCRTWFINVCEYSFVWQSMSCALAVNTFAVSADGR